MQIFGYNVPHGAALSEAFRKVDPEIHFRQLSIDEIRRRRIRSIVDELVSPALSKPDRVSILRIHSERRITGSDDDRVSDLSTLASLALFSREIRHADRVVIWNGLKSKSLLAASTARALGKPMVYAERGLLPNTIQIDPVGVNPRSNTLRSTPGELQGMDFAPADFDRVDRIEFSPRPLGDNIMASPSNLEDLPPDLPEDFLLFAAQVHDDTQISWYSPRFPTVESAIRYVLVQARELAQRTGRRMPVVVKPHPQDHGRIEYRTLQEEFPGCIFLGYVDNAKLIRRCGCFVTINSSLSLQAVHAGVPVITLGEAAYNIPGVVEALASDKDLWQSLETGVSFSEDLRRRYLAHLVTTALLPFDVREPTPEQLEAIARRILDLTGNQ